MASVELSGDAQDDLAAIRRYIAEFGHSPNPDIADRTVERILDALRILEAFPQAGKPGRVEGTRELHVSTVPYYAVYRSVGEDRLVVTAIFHDRQQYPPDEAGA
ncbi:MAG: type II toxin-antitoxin system RelE/ParE family toxin [Roseitalea porphyridii]|uniref:type II toxin-antitoxin system RelE/ParE family toxin n=1 Tax=Roseitalea porphyridii TaxID=1852022 RepID=UPI0032D96B2E